MGTWSPEMFHHRIKVHKASLYGFAVTLPSKETNVPNSKTEPQEPQFPTVFTDVLLIDFDVTSVIIPIQTASSAVFATEAVLQQ